MELQLRSEAWPYATPFRITNHVFTTADVLTVALSEGGLTGWGEAGGVYYHGALWDLEANRRREPVWRLAGMAAPRALTTTFTIGADTPAAMARAALAYDSARAIKLKLTADDPIGCVRAVRAARPDVWLGVDANQGLTRAKLQAILPNLVEADVELIEQPLPVGEDAALEGLDSPIAIAADESVQGLASLGALVARFDVVNIKLDKCGGLTEGLAMAREARRLGLRVMVGCMSGTSLSVAPAFVLGQVCDLVDLDGPTFLSADRARPATYLDGRIWCPDDLWGAPTMTGQAVSKETAK